MNRSANTSNSRPDQPAKGRDRLDPRREAFGEALRAALAQNQTRQSDLAMVLGVTQASVSSWVTGKAEPPPAMVFEVEAVLGVPAGSLSTLLGYLPLAPRGVRRPPSQHPREAALADGRTRLTYTVDETARMLGVSTDLVYDLCCRGELAFVRAGRRKLVLAAALRQWLHEKSLVPPVSSGGRPRATSGRRARPP